MGLRKISSEVDWKERRRKREGQNWFETRRDEGNEIENSPLRRFESCAGVEEADRVGRVLPTSLQKGKEEERKISDCREKEKEEEEDSRFTFVCLFGCAGVPPADTRLDPRLELGWKLPEELAVVA